ncbi:MAG: ABC transporter permease, partial [Gemmatimonadaceae bacterium]
MEDIRFALRAMRRAPGFFAGAVLILALGIGLSTAAFEIFYAVLVRPLPVREQARLVALAGDLPGSRLPLFPMKRRLVRAFAREMRTLTEVAGIAYDGPWEWKVRDPADDHQTVVLHSSVVTGNFFQVLGARAEIGRTLLPQDDARGAKKVVVISHDLWQREYGGDAGVLGRRVLDQGSGDAYEIVGVLPAGLALERGADTWRTLDTVFPILADSDLDSRFALMRLVGRLAPGATPAASGAELAAFLRREWRAQNPAMASRLTATAHPLTDDVVGDVRPALRIVSAAVALLLLIACVNVANLLLIRGARRRAELAVRASLGASRSRLIRQLVVEGVVLVALGAIVGVSIAAGALAAAGTALSAYLPRVAEARVEGVTVAAAAIVAAIAVLVSVVGPALTVSSSELFSLVRSGAASVTGSRRARLARRALVVVQVALAMVVVAAAGLLGESLRHLQRVQLGFAVDRLDVIEVVPRNDAQQSAATINATM